MCTLNNEKNILDMIDSDECSIINDDTYYELPQILKNKYMWIKEYDDTMYGYFTYRKHGLNKSYFDYIDRAGDILLDESEYNYLPSYLKEKYDWCQDVHRTTVKEWIIYRKDSYSLHYIDVSLKISLHESTYNKLPEYMKTKYIWIGETIDGYKYYTKESIELDKIQI